MRFVVLDALVSPLSAYDLRCEHLTEPLGIDEPVPRFTWRLRSAEGGQRQGGYRIRVSAAVARTPGEAWDSGWVESGEHAEVAYAGAELGAETRYEWTLSLRDRDGRACPAVSS